MAWPLFSTGGRKILGVDIGTSTIKIVELEKAAERITLENYGQIQSKFLYGKPFRSFEKSTLSLSTRDIASALVAINKEAKIRTRRVNFSLPDFSSFFTTFSLPPMSKDEMARAVRFEARQHVPLPLSEMALDWELIEGEASEQRKESLKVLLVAVPQRVVSQYQEIAALAKLELQNLEAEVLALNRALSSEEEGVIALVDIGAQSTTCSIVEKGVVKISHSFDLSGNNLTKALVEALEVDAETAERLKLKYGLSPKGEAIPMVLQPLLDSIIMEIKKISRHYFKVAGRESKKVVLAGGTANLKGVRDYFSRKIGKRVEVANPFTKVAYPQVLEGVLKKEGPSFAIAVGVAMGALP